MLRRASLFPTPAAAVSRSPTAEPPSRSPDVAGDVGARGELLDGVQEAVCRLGEGGARAGHQPVGCHGAHAATTAAARTRGRAGFPRRPGGYTRLSPATAGTPRGA